VKLIDLEEGENFSGIARVDRESEARGAEDAAEEEASDEAGEVEEDEIAE